MIRQIIGLSLACLVLSVPAAHAMRPHGPGEQGSVTGGVHARPPVSHPRPQILPQPESTVTDVETVYFLMSSPAVVKVLNKAITRHGMNVSKISMWRKGRTAGGFRIHLAPKVKPPHGINGGGFFTATISPRADDRPEIDEVSEISLAR